MKALPKAVKSGFLLLIILFVAITNDFFVNNSVVTFSESSISLEKGWTYRWEDNGKTGILSLPGVATGGKRDEALWISNTLPKDAFKESTLFFNDITTVYEGFPGRKADLLLYLRFKRKGCKIAGKYII